MIKLKTNPIVAELMDNPRPTRRRIQELLRMVHKDGRLCQKNLYKRVAKIKNKSKI